MGVDWGALFEMNVPAAELIVRGTAMYWFLFLVFRFVLRRDVGAVGIADILLLVLLADASQNAMAGGYETVAEGMVLVGTLIFWNYAIDWAAFRWNAVRRLVEPPPLLLVRCGRVIHRNLRAEYVTLSELKAHLRANGLASWHGVRAAFMESDGTFTVVKDKKGGGNDDDAAPGPRPPSVG